MEIVDLIVHVILCNALKFYSYTYGVKYDLYGSYLSYGSFFCLLAAGGNNSYFNKKICIFW